MKQILQNFRSGELKVQDVPAPAARAGCVLVANRHSLISAGTEKSTVGVAQKTLVGKAMDRPDLARKVLDKVRKDGLVETMKMVFARLDTPATLGYSCAGRVIDVGRGVPDFRVGDLVACAGQNYASHAEVVSIPRNLCVKVPEGLELADAAYVTLGAIALQGVRQADPRLGEIVAVIGLGLLGQITVQLLKANGCRVVASDLDPGKLALAREFGAEEAVLPDDLEAACASITTGMGVDAVILTASTKDDGPVRIAGEICRKKGRVVVVGAVGMNIPREMYYVKELELRLSTSYGPGRYDLEYEEKGQDYPYGYVRWTENRNMAEFLALLASGQVNVRRLTSHRFPITDGERAYALMMEGKEPYLGILLDYPGMEAPPARRRIELAAGPKRQRLALGLIGAGNHVKDMLLPPLRRLPGIEVRGVCTGTGANARQLADKLGASFCTADYREVLADPEIDGVLIGTRHGGHGAQVVAALEAGKHVFVEKPLCLTEEELVRIEEIYPARAQAGQRLMVGFNRRFSPHADKARDFFRDRRNPLVMTYRVNAGAIPATHWIQDPAAGGGRILGEACHFVDFMTSLTGALPVHVHARAISHHASGLTDDQCAIMLGFADGSVGTILYAAGGDTALEKEYFEAFGDGRSLTLRDYQLTECYAQRRRERFRTRTRDKGFAAEMAAFAGDIFEARPPSMPFEQIAAVTRACLLAVKSLRTGEPYNF